MSSPETETSEALKIKRQEHMILRDIKQDFSLLMPSVLEAKMAEQNILTQSAADGGPSSSMDALRHMLNQAKMGMRELAQRTGVKRKLLLGMIEGRIDMSGEVRSKIIAALKQKRPELFKFDPSTLT